LVELAFVVSGPEGGIPIVLVPGIFQGILKEDLQK